MAGTFMELQIEETDEGVWIGDFKFPLFTRIEKLTNLRIQWADDPRSGFDFTGFKIDIPNQDAVRKRSDPPFDFYLVEGATFNSALVGSLKDLDRLHSDFWKTWAPRMRMQHQ